MENLLTLCDKVVERALKAGADEAEAIAGRGREVNVELQKNDLQIAKSMSADGLGLRVFKDRSLGFAYVNSFDDDGLTALVESAMGIASAAPADEHNELPGPTPVAALGRTYDEASEGFGVDAAVESALKMLRTARDFDARVSIDSGEFAGQFGERAISSSRGVRASERNSYFYCYIFGLAKEGEVVSSFDFQFDGAAAVSRLDPESVARKFAENVVGSLGAVKGESFRGPVILAPKAAEEIVLSPITYAVKASTIQKETSKFLGRMGQTVACELLNVTDDATLTDGSYTTSFDREGVAPEVLPLIDGGVLKNFLYDSYTARKEGRASNGHAGGGASAVPSVASTNVVLAPGTTPVADMISGVDKGVLVTRFSGNVDPVSGDFSGSVKGGRMIRGGRLAEPLCGTMIAGNSFELLTDITAVSIEHERSFGTIVPYLSLEQVAVTSG